MSGERFQVRNLAPEYRRAGLIAGLLFVCMLLPWYTRSSDQTINGRLTTTETSLSAFSSFSFVEAAVLLVAVAVLALIYVRGQRRAFHLPGGDGIVIAAAGGWVSALVLYRTVDNKQGGLSDNLTAVDYGPKWGIFVTLLVGLALMRAGLRLRAAHVAEPPNPTAEAPPRARRAPLPREDPRWEEDPHETQIAQDGHAVDPLRYDDRR